MPGEEGAGFPDRVSVPFPGLGCTEARLYVTATRLVPASKELTLKVVQKIVVETPGASRLLTSGRIELTVFPRGRACPTLLRKFWKRPGSARRTKQGGSPAPRLSPPRCKQKGALCPSRPLPSHQGFRNQHETWVSICCTYPCHISHIATVRSAEMLRSYLKEAAGTEKLWIRNDIFPYTTLQIRNKLLIYWLSPF